MTINRRTFLQSSAALAPLFSGAGGLLAGISSSAAQAAAEPLALKISHQFPGGSLTDGDFRDRLC